MSTGRQEYRTVQHRKATRGQIGRITNLLLSGAIPFEEAQRIIGRVTKADVVGLDGKKEDIGTLAYWKLAFPGLEHRFVEFFEPMIGMTRVIGPAQAGVRRRAMDAIFWRKVPRVIPVNVDRMSLNRLMQEKVLHSLEGRYPFFREIGKWREEAITKFAFMLTDRVKRGTGGLSEENTDATTNLMMFACFAAKAIYRTDWSLVEKLKPYRDLLVDGNPPLGFTKKGNLLVAVTGEVPPSGVVTAN